jgi:protein-S-isoprenylcysteine O-methyltransferase Ste14
MNELSKKSFAGLLFVLLVMAALLFLPAWTVNYWQAWVFLAVFGGCSLAITVYLMKYDPKLLERRVNAGPTAEKERTQKIIQSITSAGFAGMLVVPGLDHRFHWSRMSICTTVAGDALLAAGFLIMFFVYRENSFASATVEVIPEQRVISTGLYAVVRHPMYLGGIFWFIAMALSLGSWWALFAFVLILPALIWRIFDEEKLLARNLPGYRAYCQRVRFRLVPFIW